MDAKNQAANPSSGGSNLSPSTYQVNVNRKKTRKWVEAKVQNYDGDDWGAPESDAEDDSPVSAPPPVPHPRPSGGTRLPSESRVAGAGRPGQSQSPVSVPTYKPPVEENVPAMTGPSNLVDSSKATDNVMSPVPERPSSIQDEPAILPASTYEQQPKQDSVQSSQAAEPASDADPDSKRVSVSPQLPNMARMSGFGVDFFSAGGAETANNREPTVQEEREPSPQPTAEKPFAVPEVKGTQESGVPQTTITPSPVEPPAAEPQKNEQQEAAQTAQPAPRRPSLPGQYVTEDPTHEILPTPLSPPAQVNEPEVSPVSEHAPKDVAETSVSDADSQRLQPGAEAKSLPPLRTPSPHEPRTVPPPEEKAVPAVVQSAGSERSKPEITPTEPLQPKSAAQYTPSDYETQPLSRQYTLDTTTSSPVKESDVLSDEIMRTLTPGGLTASSENSDDKRKSQMMPTGRESSYTLSGYDDYWADTADKTKSTAPGGLEDVPEVPPVPTVVPTEPTAAKSPEPAAASPEQIVSPMSDASLRRRFSWEALEQPEAAAPTATIGAAQATQPSASASEAPKADEHESVSSPGVTLPASPTIKVVPDTSSISHQVSQASSKPATLPTPEPPSPVSELSDRDATPLAQPVASSTDGGAHSGASPLSSNPVPGSQSEAQTPKIMSPTPMSADKPIMTFREIMEIPNPKDRIAKYEETRNSFGSQDSGLDNWLTTMRSEHPEHANATGSYSGASVSGPPSSAGGITAGPGQHPSADQPYYQQYLQANANAPSASQTGSARSRIAGYSSQAQAAAGSAFGDGGKQIGTKGKEFMHSAGKMGKGLFSKGKSKLQQAREAREARGDKGDTSPPPVDRKPQRPERPERAERPDRTMSWGLSFGGQKSRENGPTPPEASTGHSGNGHERQGSNLSELSKEPPKLAEPPRFSPILSDPSHTGGDEGVFWQDTNTHNENAENPNQPRSFGGIPAAQGGPGLEAQGSRSQAQRIEPPPNEDSDWVVVPRQSADQHDQDTVPTGQNAHHPQQQQQHLKSAVVPEDSGIGMASQSPDTRPDAQRHSSFRGLPPIRRNSSFGLSAFDATGDPGRVSPIENDDDVPAQYGGTAGSSYQQQHQNGTLQPHENATSRSVGADSNVTLIGQDSTARTGRSSMSLSKEPMRFYQPQQQQQQPLHIDTQGQQPHPGQGPDAVNPIQRTPPSGWQLEESHLAAPLHVARRRAGTDSSQQQVTYGYDKETGSNVPMSPSSPGAGTGGSNRLPSPPAPRQRVSDVPPSSARRYPDLFRPANPNQPPQQRVRANSGGQQQMAGYQQGPRPSQDSQPSVNDKVHEAGFDMSRQQNEDQEKRKPSDILKSIGGRFKKSNNTEERRNSVNSGLERTDTMTSVNSNGQTSQKKKRASFLPSALRSRPSMDVAAPPQINDPNRPVTQESIQGPDRSGTPQSEKKRSLLGGKLSAAQHKFLPGSQRGSSTSNLANDSNSVNGGADSVHSMGPSKKRFSGFTDKAATFAGRFRSSGDENSQAGNIPQDPASMSQSSLPPPPPPKSRGRSASAASAGSHGMTPPPAPGADADERRGRRGSFQGMMSNLMGRSSSKSREVETQHGQAEGAFVHQHPGAPTQQQYGGQGPYPPMQGQMQHPGQYAQQTHVQNEQGRRSPGDPSQRASRVLSGQFMQPPRPSPLAQESSATGPQSPVQSPVSRDEGVVSPEAPSNASERATSPSVAPSEGRVSPMPFAVSRKPTRTERQQAAVSPSPASVSSPIEETHAEHPKPSVTSDARAEVQPAEEVQPSEEVQPTAASHDDPPLSPVKRQPTPHASALFSSMAATSERPPPVPAVEDVNQTRTAEPASQSPPSAAPSGHIRTDSVTSSRPPQSITGYGPSRESTPVQSPPGPPSAGHPSGSQQGSPAQLRQPEGRFSPPAGQSPHFPQNPQQFPPQFMQHRPQGSPQTAQQHFGQQQGPRPGPSQGPQSPQQPPQGFHQGPGPQGAPQGPPGTQSVFQQNGGPQPQSSPAHPQGQESKLKGWKNRMSTQMAQIKAQSQRPEEPRQEAQQVQQPTKESWKDRLANMAPSSQVKAEQPQQQAQGQAQHESWKDRLANMAPSSQVKAEQTQQHPHGQAQQESWKDRFANMAPSAQVKTQQPQQQPQQPVQAQAQAREPSRPNGAVMGAPQPSQPQPSQVMQPQQPQVPQPSQPPQRIQSPQYQGQAQTQAQPAQPGQGKPEKSSWKTRVSSQFASISAQGSSDKPANGDKPATGNKLLDALKRASKPADQPPTPPSKNNQPPQQSQWRPSPVQQVPFRAPPPPQEQGRQHPFAPDSAYGQYAQQAQMRPQQQMPQGQYPQYPPQQQQQPQWQGQQHPAQHPSHPQHQQWVYQQQMAMQQQQHQQQQAGRPPPEPQYDQVPIPKGYGQVHGEYNPTQAQGQPMYQGQMHPQQYQQYYQGQYPPQQMQQVQQMQQQAYYQGGQVPALQGPSEPASAVPQVMQQGQQPVAGRESPASPPEQGGFNLPIQGNITPGETNSPQLPMQGAQQQAVQAQQVNQTQQQPQQFDLQQEQALQRPPAVRADTFASDAGRSMESGVMGGMGQRVLPPGQPQQQIHPQPSTTSMNGQYVSGSASPPKADISRSTSINPGGVVEEPNPNPNPNNLAIDVEKSKQDTDENIYDATPRLQQETTGNSQGVSDQSSSKHPTPEPHPKSVPPINTAREETNASPPMELEDTADARMRTIRIGEQEEKIFYDPEGDIPKMSATSYPGQEWNPYGEPEFATDWRDDDGR